jgi:hypothetical protein
MAKARGKQTGKTRTRKKSSQRRIKRASIRRTPEELLAYDDWQRRREAGSRERVLALQRAVEDFASAAGIDFAAVPGGIQLGLTTPVLFTDSERSGGDIDQVIDRVVSESAADKLLEVTIDELDGRGLPLRAVRGKGGICLLHGSNVVSVIRATRGTFKHREDDIPGNFLVTGKHWQSLRAHVSGEPRSSLAEQTVLTQLPADVPEALALAALSASTRLREERCVEFGHTICLQFTDGFIRFAPIHADRHTVEVPFVYEHDSGHALGALRLRTPGDPLALALAESSGEDVVGEAWVTALRGYADLTCIEHAAAAETTPTPVTSTNPAPRPAGSASSRRRTLVDAARTLVPYSSTLTPTEATRSLLASYVVGHRRQLPAGRQPGEEAREHAKRIGVTLGPGQTWVKPHARGVPDGAELVFAWAVADP